MKLTSRATIFSIRTACSCSVSFSGPIKWIAFSCRRDEDEGLYERMREVLREAMKDPKVQVGRAGGAVSLV